MRVACVNQDPGIAPGRAKGAAVHLAAMRRAFVACGAEVVAIDCSEPAELLAELASADAVAPLGILYERYALGRAAAARFAVARALPFCLEVNAPLAFETDRWRGERDREADRLADRELFAAATRVLAVSTEVAAYAIERGAAPGRVEVTPNGVDCTLFAPERRIAASESGIDDQRFVVGFHGRLRPWHGIELLAAACRDLLGLGVDLHLVTVGEGEFDAAFAPHVPADRRTSIGWLPHEEVGRWVARFDALPLTYPADLPCYFSPLKLAEAMASGAVPVVPAMGDLADAVGDGGVLYPPGDRAALVAAVAALAADPGRRSTLARAAIRRAGERSWRRIAERLLEQVAAGSPA